jgi:hypothetical protein
MEDHTNILLDNWEKIYNYYGGNIQNIILDNISIKEPFGVENFENAKIINGSNKDFIRIDKSEFGKWTRNIISIKHQANPEDRKLRTNIPSLLRTWDEIYLYKWNNLDEITFDITYTIGLNPEIFKVEGAKLIKPFPKDNNSNVCIDKEKYQIYPRNIISIRYPSIQDKKIAVDSYYRANQTFIDKKYLPPEIMSKILDKVYGDDEEKKGAEESKSNKGDAGRRRKSGKKKSRSKRRKSGRKKSRSKRRKSGRIKK